MKFKKALLSCLLMSALTVSAQEDQQPKIEYVHTPYWYVQAQIGGQYTLGEIDFGHLVSPNAQVALGYQFSPIWGARLAVNAWQSRAGIDFAQTTLINQAGVISSLPKESTKWKWMYVAPGVDLTANLSNLIAGYNPTRAFSLSALAGLGANIAWGMDKESNWYNKEAITTHYANTYHNGFVPENIEYAWDGTKARMYLRFGLAGDYRINDKLSVGLELNANTLSDRYNGKRAGNWDWYFNALVGVKYNLGATHTTRTIEAPKPVERVVEKVIERVVKEPASGATNAAQFTNARAEVKEPFQREVFFNINSSKITTESSKVKEVADYMKANPETKVDLSGYADKATGNSSINMRLSQQRVQAVYNMLTKTYGIDKSRITTNAKGDTVQPHEKIADNRVTICIVQ